MTKNNNEDILDEARRLIYKDSDNIFRLIEDDREVTKEIFIHLYHTLYNRKMKRIEKENE